MMHFIYNGIYIPAELSNFSGDAFKFLNLVLLWGDKRFQAFNESKSQNK